MAATLDNLIDELERSYKETQERMSDPSVYNDHREAAEVGRRLKELEGPYKLAQEWRCVRADLAGARQGGDPREALPRLGGASAATRPRCGRATSTGCSPATPSGAASRSKSSARARTTAAATRTSPS